MASSSDKRKIILDICTFLDVSTEVEGCATNICSVGHRHVARCAMNLDRTVMYTNRSELEIY